MADSPENDAALKRETLTSRARRIIGRALETPKDDSGSASSKKGPPKKATTKRREQVLQAQRTHRQRTQGYIRELEKEVLRLREVESSLQNETSMLNAKLQILEQTLLINNVTVPDLTTLEASTHLMKSLNINHSNGNLAPDNSVAGGVSPSPSSRAMSDSDTTAWSTISGHSPNKGSMVTVDLTSMQTLPAFAVKGRNVEMDVIEPVNLKELEAPSRFPTLANSSASPDFNTQEALDFVLGVEKVCFSHLKTQFIDQDTAAQTAANIPECNYGANHAYMAVTNILNHQMPTGHNPIDKPFKVPVVDLDKMFKASINLDFGTDVTPVQIWANLSRLVQKGYMIDRELFQLLMKEFAKYSRCNGYGAVVERGAAEQLIHYYFPGETYVESWKS